MKLLCFTLLSLFTVSSPPFPDLPKQELIPSQVLSPRPIIRNFMVTVCEKGKCLNKMRPHERYIDKNGQIAWKKIQ